VYISAVYTSDEAVWEILKQRTETFSTYYRP